MGPNHRPVPTSTCHSLEIPFSHSALQQHKLSLHSRSHSTRMYAIPVYTYVHTSQSTCMYTHPCLHVYTHILVYTYARISQSTCMYTHPILHYVHISQPTHMYAHPNLHVCTHELIVGTLCSAQSCPSPPSCMLKAVT